MPGRVQSPQNQLLSCEEQAQNHCTAPASRPESLQNICFRAGAGQRQPWVFVQPQLSVLTEATGCAWLPALGSRLCSPAPLLRPLLVPLLQEQQRAEQAEPL